MKDKKFPVREKHLSRLKNQIKNGDTLDNMRDNIASDPLLAFAILNEANRNIRNKNNDITSPLHAAAIVGINGIVRLLPNFAPYYLDPKQTSPHLSAFLSEVQTSYEAASIAKLWVSKKQPSGSDDIFWITLFRDTAKWLLWLYAYPTMTRINQRLKKGEAASHVELSELGCRIDEITARLFILWHTPHRIVEGFYSKNVPNSSELQTLAHLAHDIDQLPNLTENKRLTILINNPLIFSYCANKVAHEAHLTGWDSKHLPFLYRVVAASMHCYLSEITYTAHIATVQSARHYNIGGKAPLAQQLLNPDLYLRYAPKPKTPNCPVSSLKKALNKHSLFDTKQKANMALKAITKSIPSLKHCIIFKHANHKTLPLYQSGYEINKVKMVKWNTHSSVFSKLSQQATAVHFSNKTLESAQVSLPYGADKILEKNSQLVLLSTQVTQKETVIFWIETSAAFNQKDYTTLKKIVSAISHRAA
ncbi:HDOD domain-containing protein [Marinomonas vulgaris]|uniref:HDOD domain-containing protein n=1 Tax=Marinomonas vulgaris TaxID=2823372 RepID=UPI001F349E11|nr:HDOD domain-containing protein [Marinomonas vulgaris]